MALVDQDTNSHIDRLSIFTALTLAVCIGH
jgi:hypothetical protein